MIQKNTIKINIKIGTSGYSYEDWRGVFYPEDIPKYKMLGFYSQYFEAVEINASYYVIPKQDTFRRMTERTPPHFQFIVKVHQETTHRRKENEASLNQLTESLKPMIDSGKFMGLLAQFPYSFKNNEKNRRYLADTRKFCKDLPLFVEFRHAGWNNPQMIQFLRENNIGYVNVDEPQLYGLLPQQSEVSSDAAYIRFHGRNEADWWEGKGNARYDYEYREEELREWLTHISDILKKTYKTYIFFNNHPKGKAIRNARQMMDILSNQLQISFT